MGAEAQALGSRSTACPRGFQGAALKLEQLGHKVAHIWDASVAGCDPVHYTTLAPKGI